MVNLHGLQLGHVADEAGVSRGFMGHAVYNVLQRLRETATAPDTSPRATYESFSIQTTWRTLEPGRRDQISAPLGCGLLKLDHPFPSESTTSTHLQLATHPSPQS